MNNSEFKAWFGGFTENLDGPPNKKQWARIKEKVDRIGNSWSPYSSSHPCHTDWLSTTPAFTYNTSDTVWRTLGTSDATSVL